MYGYNFALVAEGGDEIWFHVFADSLEIALEELGKRIRYETCVLRFVYDQANDKPLLFSLEKGKGRLFVHIFSESREEAIATAERITNEKGFDVVSVGIPDHVKESKNAAQNFYEFYKSDEAEQKRHECSLYADTEADALAMAEKHMGSTGFTLAEVRPKQPETLPEGCSECHFHAKRKNGDSVFIRSVFGKDPAEAERLAQAILPDGVSFRLSQVFVRNEKRA